VAARAAIHPTFPLAALAAELAAATSTLIHLGDTRHALGQPDAARAAWTDALHILTDLDHPDADTVRATLATLGPMSPPPAGPPPADPGDTVDEGQYRIVH
jgi:hypothetical protein